MGYSELGAKSLPRIWYFSYLLMSFLELSWVAGLSEHSAETAQVAEEKGPAYFSDPKGRVASSNSASGL